MSAINLTYSETVKELKKISHLDPDNIEKLALRVDEYIKFKDFPHPEDDGTKEQWDQFSKDLWERKKDAVKLVNIVNECISNDTEPPEPPFVVKCIAKGAYAIGYGISMFGRFYNEEANDTWFNKKVEFIYT